MLVADQIAKKRLKKGKKQFIEKDKTRNGLETKNHLKCSTTFHVYNKLNYESKSQKKLYIDLFKAYKMQFGA